MKKQVPAVLDYIMEILEATISGEVVLIVQDGVLLQVESTRKTRVHPWQGVTQPDPWTTAVKKNLRQVILRELESLYFGQLRIVVKNGVATHFSRIEKQRFMDGDGI